MENKEKDLEVEIVIAKINCLKDVLSHTNHVSNMKEVQELTQKKLVELINKL
jgi:hypothetical protein